MLLFCNAKSRGASIALFMKKDPKGSGPEESDHTSVLAGVESSSMPAATFAPLVTEPTSEEEVQFQMYMRMYFSQTVTSRF